MRSRILRLIAIATFIFVISVLLLKFDVLKDSISRNKGWFLLVTLFYLAGRWFDGIRLKILVAHYGLTLPRCECFGLSIMYPFYNHFFPNAGLVTNAQYMKSKYGFKYRLSVAVGLIRVIMAVIICGIVGAWGSIAYMSHNNTHSLLYILFFYLFLITAAISGLFIPVPAIVKRYSFLNKLSEAVTGMKNLRKEFKLFFKLSIVQAVLVLIFVARYYFVYKSLSINVPFINVAAIMPLTFIANLLNIVPANFAIREAIIGATSVLIGNTLSEGLLVASLDRIVIVTNLLVFGSIFFFRLKYYNMGLSGEKAVDFDAQDE